MSVSLPNLLGKSSSNLSVPEKPAKAEQILEGDETLRTTKKRACGPSAGAESRRKEKQNKGCSHPPIPALHATRQVSKPERSLIWVRHYITANLQSCVEGEWKVASRTGASLMNDRSGAHVPGGLERSAAFGPQLCCYARPKWRLNHVRARIKEEKKRKAAGRLGLNRDIPIFNHRDQQDVYATSCGPERCCSVATATGNNHVINDI